MSERYAKQRIFLGAPADARLRTRRVAVVGVGATGSVIAGWLARAGVGLLTLIDRDIVETSNLQRQILFQEGDLFRPKAEVAAQRLREANSSIQVEAAVTDLTSGNARELLGGYDLIMDGTDNFEARYLINDYAILTGTPWIYSGAIGGEGLVWPIEPPRTPCLRCLMEEPPPSGDIDTCDTAGVLGPTVGIVGSWAALEAIKLLTGTEPHAELARFDFWQNERQFLSLPATRCRFCTDKVTEFLNARWTVKASRLCGLDGVQIRVNPPGALDLEALRTRIEKRTGNTWKINPLSLSGREGDLNIILFRDGRALLHGDISPERARGWYTEVVGC
ncbi:ThiF family adenylyltransferase [Mesoterricola silvestris]|uniref:Sulfur carrier protein ThiS adenylyltransferase n=1 Tax=Mesoterricola silvestris TaxID=2927979 RepID=A0AA48GNL4_9BACT|nr:ThiF family adenylyltransferase [Mesoterricola silvestris]BDU74634.1 sulfur carrier protein ThiS adenylyltransferase [Mesoterricola silvestris]